jgi:two-component system, chemotaxis family, response regulator Rcp1
MEDESGSNPNRAKDQPSFSPARSDILHRYLIALIEDNPADAFLVQEAITNRQISANLVVIRDGEKAIRAIGRVDADDDAIRPNLFLLDLNLPTRTGEEVLTHIRNSRRLSMTPVVVMTSSGSPKDRAMAESLGASRYFCKPSDYDSFMRLGEVIEEILTRIGPS